VHQTNDALCGMVKPELTVPVDNTLTMQRPPPLQLLPAFEASARLLSFSKAGLELHITTAAISQQIKQLEGHLGLPLFVRLTRRVELTEAGKEFAQVVTHTLSSYRLGHAQLMHRHTKPVLRLSVSPLVAYELLIPNLAAFQQDHPDVDIRIEASMGLADFDNDPIDAAIRFGADAWPGLASTPLCACQAILVAAPSLLAKLPVRTWADLGQHTLIHPRQSRMDWTAVAQYANHGRLERKGDLVLDSDLAALRAAEQGLGVAIVILPAHSPLAHSDRVVAVLPPIDLPLQAHFVYRPNSGKQALLDSACDWMRRQLTQQGMG